MGKAGQARQVFRIYGAKRGVRKTQVKGAAKPPPPNLPKLKKGLEPGTIVILLAGRFRGKRVVFVKQLPSGLLLTTGPYAVNGVPLRRVNQPFCITTSTKVDLKVENYAEVTDIYFSKGKKSNKRRAKAKKTEANMFATEPEKKGMSDEKKAGEKKMDEAVVASLAPDVKEYLKTRFSLSAKDYPHALKF